MVAAAYPDVIPGAERPPEDPPISGGRVGLGHRDHVVPLGVTRAAVQEPFDGGGAELPVPGGGRLPVRRTPEVAVPPGEEEAARGSVAGRLPEDGVGPPLRPGLDQQGQLLLVREGGVRRARGGRRYDLDLVHLLVCLSGWREISLPSNCGDIGIKRSNLYRK